MADLGITLKIMPAEPDTDIEALAAAVKQKITEFVDEKHKTQTMDHKIEPAFFGLKALIIGFKVNESAGETEKLEKSISEISDVKSVEITSIGRIN